MYQASGTSTDRFFLPPKATASLSGALCGLLGLTSLPGFVFYLLTSLLIGLAFSGTKARASPKEYFVGGWWEVLGGDTLANAAPFVLFWTCAFGLDMCYGRRRGGVQRGL